MGYLYAAYTLSGDLIADGYSMWRLERRCEELGYADSDYFIARVNP